MTADLEKLVKPLVWRDVDTYGGTVWDAVAAGVVYRIIHKSDGKYWLTDPCCGTVVPTIKAAKAAAQADYASRIAAALDPDAVAKMVQEAKAEALQGPWTDEPDDLTDAVMASHPFKERGDYKTYCRALELVSNRHSKGALVSLVNYLLRQSQEAVKAEREACAAWCEMNTMDTVIGVTGRKYAGMYTNGENNGGTHSGMGYAAAIRARGEA